MFEVAAFIFSPIVGHYLSVVGRKNVIMYGIVIMAISTTGNGVLAYIPSGLP